MAQHDYVIDNSTGANVRADINNALLAISSNNSGSSAPSTTYALQSFANTTDSMLQLRNAANNAFVNLRKFDGSLPLPDGSVSSPSLFFDDDTNTGIFSSAADTFNVATGGVERMELGATTIFNEDGADVDFRIEGDTNANLFYVDAGNNKIGIGTSTPDTVLDVVHTDVSASAGTNDIAVFRKTDEGYIKVLSNNSGTGGIAFGDTDDNFIGAVRYDHGDDALEFFINNSERARIDSSGRVGIGTTSPTSAGSYTKFLQISDSNSASVAISRSASGSAHTLELGAFSGASLIESTGATSLRFKINNSERMRIDSSGNLVVGATSAQASDSATLMADGEVTAAGFYFTNNIGSPMNSDGIRRATTGTMAFDTASAERMRINQEGLLLINEAKNGMSLGFGQQQLSVKAGVFSPAIFESTGHTLSTMLLTNSSTVAAVNMVDMRCARAGNSAFTFFIMRSGASSSSSGDTEMKFVGDGNAFADGSFTGGGADYAEYFEWADGNSSDEDRRGYTVVLDGNKIRKSTSSDASATIIGVVSGNPSVVGDGDIDRWKQKYQKDDYGTYIRDENGDKILNTEFDETKTYISRAERKEWDIIGLMGKIRVRKGQTMGTNWIKMQDISDTVEEWLVK